MPKTKSFIVAVAGDTVDGRTIEEQWLKDIAATYVRATYGARVNKEHIVGLSGTEPFKAYGDVLSCTTEEITLQIAGKPVKKLALRAEIEASDDLVAMTSAGQKIYTSIEVAPNFANTGKAYLMGLAVTDTPASLGTDVLSFAIQHPGAIPLGPRVKAAGNLFTPGFETSFELADGEKATPPADSAAGLLAAVTDFIRKFGKSDPVTPPAVETPATPPKEPANDNDARFATLLSGIAQLTTGVEKLGTELRGELGKLRTDHAALATRVDATPAPETFKRAPATGGSDAILTNC